MLLKTIILFIRQSVNNASQALATIISLSLGMVITCLLGLHIYHEVTFDKQWDHSHRIYQVISVNESSELNYFVDDKLGDFNIESLIEEISSEDVEFQSSLLVEPGEYLINGESQSGTLALVSEDFSNVFQLELASGDWSQTLSNVNNIALPISIAYAFFNEVNVINRSVTFRDIEGREQSYIVTAIFYPPKKTMVEGLDSPIALLAGQKFGVFEPQVDEASDRIIFRNFNHFLKLKDGVDGERFSQLLEVVSRQRTLNNSARQNHYYSLQLLTDIHLFSKFSTPLAGSVIQIIIVGFLSILIAGSTFVNFVLLTALRASAKSREIWLRIALGSNRLQLIYNQLFESFILSGTAAILAFFVAKSATIYFHSTFPSLDSAFFSSQKFVLFYFLVVFVLTFFSSLYPSLTYTKMVPNNALRQCGIKFRHGSIFTVFLFAVAVVLVVGAVSLFAQVHFLTNRDRGFDYQNVYLLEVTKIDQLMKLDSLMSELNKIPGVANLTMATQLPDISRIDMPRSTLVREDVEGNVLVSLKAIQQGIVANFFTTFSIPILQGRAIEQRDVPVLGGQRRIRPSNSETSAPVTTKIVLNELAAKQLGYSEPMDSIGQQIFQEDWLSNGNRNLTRLEIVGVAGNSQFLSFRSPFQPMYYVANPVGGRVAVKIDPRATRSVIPEIDKTWQELMGTASNGYFPEERYRQIFDKEHFEFQMFFWSSLIGTFLAILSVILTLSFSLQRRRSEISIRKVYGATMKNIASLCLRDYIGGLGLAALISLPISGWIVNRLLEEFPIRLDSVSLVLLNLLSIALLVGLAAMFVVGTVYRISNDRPMISLRSE